jgi:hypothetical protein
LQDSFTYAGQGSADPIAVSPQELLVRDAGLVEADNDSEDVVAETANVSGHFLSNGSLASGKDFKNPALVPE